MKRGMILLFYVAGLLSPTLAQKTIKGKVTNAETKEPIANCYVFVDGTCAITVTDSSGNFELLNTPAGQYDLVIAKPGYETYSYSFTTEMLPLDQDVKMSMRQKPDDYYNEPGYWKKWIHLFEVDFLGFFEQNDKCSIKNPEVIKFHYYENGNILEAWADEPIRVINNTLGYEVFYHLEYFQMNMPQARSFFEGHCFFKEMIARRKSQQEKWMRYRLEAYNGSFRHFIKSLYENKLEDEGFTVELITAYPNKEKLRVRNMYPHSIYRMVKQSGTEIQRSLVFDIPGLAKGLSKLLPAAFESA